MSTLGIMTTLLTTSLCDAVLKDEQGDGLDLSAGLFGDETTKFIKETATTINTLSVAVSSLNVWVNTVKNPPVCEKTNYWVKFPNGKILMMQLNDYKQYGGPVNYWQGRDNIDKPMDDTFYIEITKPSE